MILSVTRIGCEAPEQELLALQVTITLVWSSFTDDACVIASFVRLNDRLPGVVSPPEIASQGAGGDAWTVYSMGVLTSLDRTVTLALGGKPLESTGTSKSTVLRETISPVGEASMRMEASALAMTPVASVTATVN